MFSVVNIQSGAAILKRRAGECKKPGGHQVATRLHAEGDDLRESGPLSWERAPPSAFGMTLRPAIEEVNEMNTGAIRKWMPTRWRPLRDTVGTRPQRSPTANQRVNVSRTESPNDRIAVVVLSPKPRLVVVGEGGAYGCGTGSGGAGSIGVSIGPIPCGIGS